MMDWMKRTWKILAALAVILLAGAGMGYGLGKHNSQQEVRRMARPEDYNHMMMRRLTHQLELTDEQKEVVRPMLRDASEQIYQTNRAARLKNWQTVRGFYEELESMLDEEQKAQLEESRKKVAERIRQQREQFGPRPGGPGSPGGPGGPGGPVMGPPTPPPDYSDWSDGMPPQRTLRTKDESN